MGTPVLAMHLSSYDGFTDIWIGFYFSAPAVTYIIMSFFVSEICNLLHRRMVLLIGLILFTLSVYMIATSPMLSFPDTSFTILMGLFLMGISNVMITVPLIPEILASVERQLPQLEGEELNNVISGYLSSSLGFGEALGPIISGALTEAVGFRRAFDLAASLILLFTMIYMIVNVSPETILKRKITKEEE